MGHPSLEISFTVGHPASASAFPFRAPFRKRRRMLRASGDWKVLAWPKRAGPDRSVKFQPVLLGTLLGTNISLPLVVGKMSSLVGIINEQIGDAWRLDCSKWIPKNIVRF